MADALGNETDFTYNIADQPLQTNLPATGQQGGGHSSSLNAYLYTGGPLTGVTASDESGTAIRQVNYTYGQEGETLGVGGSTEPVTYTYDSQYRLSTLTDGNGHATRYYYKQQGELDAVTYPGYTGPAPVYNATADDYSNITGPDSVRYPAYDPNGNLLKRMDGNGVETDYTHSADPQSLLTLIHYVYPAGYAGGTTGDVSLAYDAYGRRAGMTDGTGSQSFAYDDGDDPLSVTTTYAGLPAKAVSYGYWPNGSRQTMTSPIGSYSYTYDGVGRMTGMTNPYGQAAAWDYLDNGWLFHQTLSNAGAAAVVTSCSYTQRGQLTSINNRRSDNSTLSDYTGMSYDGAGNRTSWTGNIPAAPPWNRTDSYTYDAKNQLTQEASTGPLSYTNGFGYDPSGNATTLFNQGHTYNADNQDAVNTYDGNGNPAGYNGSGLTFDPENRLTQVGSVLSCGYNGDGQRAWKQNSAGARTYFLYDGSEPVCEMNGSGAVVAFNDFGADGVWARHTLTTDWFYTFDAQGSTSQKISRSGSVLCSSVFDAQGRGGTTEGRTDPFNGFGGQWGYYADWETSQQNGWYCLCLLGHRFYDPNAGRFITRDPIGYAGGINLYAYTQNKSVVPCVAIIKLLLPFPIFAPTFSVSPARTNPPVRYHQERARLGARRAVRWYEGHRLAAHAGSLPQPIPLGSKPRQYCGEATPREYFPVVSSANMPQARLWELVCAHSRSKVVPKRIFASN